MTIFELMTGALIAISIILYYTGSVFIYFAWNNIIGASHCRLNAGQTYTGKH